MAEQLLTPEDVATWLGIPKQTLYSWRAKGVGPRASRVGRHVRYRASDIETWLDQHAAPRAAVKQQARPRPVA